MVARVPLVRGHGAHATRVDPAGARGFTLVELVTVLSIFAILVVLAVPSFVELVASQRVQTATSDLFTSLVQTRSEAIKQNADVTLSPSGTWAKGWVVQGAGGPISNHGPTTNIAITAPASVTYRSSGRISAGAAPQFELSSTKTSTKRCIQVDLSGRPVVMRSKCP